MSRLKGKVAIVTGASSGIGRGIALELSKRGATVVINYKSNKSGAEKTLELLKEAGGYGHIIKADVSIYDECKTLVQEVINSFGKINILINNAGISKVGLFMDMHIEEVYELIDTNMKGTLNMSHAVLPHMTERKQGSIVNISSIWGVQGASCEAVYSSTKGAINSFTKALAKEMAPSNIRINGVAPGVIDTEMNSWMSKEDRESLEMEIPIGRFGKVQEIGEVVSYLCSDESSYLTGQIITVDGGFI